MVSENNKNKITSLQTLVEETLKRVLRKGFFGRISFHASIQDGAIQEIEKEEKEKFGHN